MRSKNKKVSVGGVDRVGGSNDGITTARQGGCWDTTFVDRGGITTVGGWDTPL